MTPRAPLDPSVPRRLVRRTQARARQAGAAILLAMLIMTLVATLAAGMVWLQWRGIEVESAERARGQGQWLLNGALDWGRLILRSSLTSGHTSDNLTQPWALPLAESRLSTFLSSDPNHSDDGGPEAFLSGQITDAQARYNLMNLVGEGSKNEIVRFGILCQAVGVPPDIAPLIASGLNASKSAMDALEEDSSMKDSTNAVLMPQQLSDIAWYGVDPAVIRQLEPFVDIFPPDSGTTNVNVNTAPVEVLMAALPGIPRTAAQTLVQRRQQAPFTSPQDAIATTQFKQVENGPNAAISVTSDFFEVYGQLRYEQHVLRERSLVHRQGSNPTAATVAVLRRQRLPPDVQ